MKLDQSKHGEFANDKRVGEGRTYDAKGKLIKTTKHKPK